MRENVVQKAAKFKAARENQDLTKGGVKFDQNKLRFDLMPSTFVEGVANVLTFGANKYNDRNWEVGMPWGRAFAACMRHLWAWWRGETNDPETGINHLFHAACNLAFLAEWAETHPEMDDRPRRKA